MCKTTDSRQLNDAELDTVTGGKDAVVGGVIVQVDNGKLLLVGYSAQTGIPIVKAF
jgi:hypothetical protein